MVAQPWMKGYRYNGEFAVHYCWRRGRAEPMLAPVKSVPGARPPAVVSTTGSDGGVGAGSGLVPGVAPSRSKDISVPFRTCRTA